VNKITRKDVKAYREKLAKQQNWICPLCREKMTPGTATLDHCHTHGNIRHVLCRACNSAEGKVLSWAKRSGAEDPAAYIENLLAYWDTDYSDNPVHPAHLTDEEKLLRFYKRRLRQVKRTRTKQRYRDKISELTRMMQEKSNG